MSEKASIQELYMSAQTAGSLVLRPDTKRSPADVLTAAGMSGRTHKAALMLWALMHTKSRQKAIALADLLSLRLEDWMARRKLRQREHALQIAREALDWWLDQNCSHCTGTGFSRIPDTPHLSADACDVCHGTGKRRLSTSNDEAAAFVLSEIQHLSVQAEETIKRKMR